MLGITFILKTILIFANVLFPFIPLNSSYFDFLTRFSWVYFLGLFALVYLFFSRKPRLNSNSNTSNQGLTEKKGVNPFVIGAGLMVLAVISFVVYFFTCMGSVQGVGTCGNETFTFWFTSIVAMVFVVSISFLLLSLFRFVVNQIKKNK